MCCVTSKDFEEPSPDLAKVSKWTYLVRPLECNLFHSKLTYGSLWEKQKQKQKHSCLCSSADSVSDLASLEIIDMM